MNQLTEKLTINTKDLIELLIDNGLLDEYFVNADVNSIFVSQVNNNDKVVQIELGLNVDLNHYKALEEKYEDKVDEEISNSQVDGIIIGLSKAFGLKPESFAVTKDFASYLNKALADERYKHGI